MSENKILARNEREANRFAAKVMLATILVVAATLVMDLMKIFIVELDVMIKALSLATVLLMIPAFLVFVLKQDKGWVKYVTVASAALMTATISTFLTFHVVILSVYSLAIASLYFSRRLSWFAVLFSMATISVSSILSFSAGGVVDKNFQTMSDIIIFGVVPRNMELMVLALIFIALSKRTRKMLENVMGAEEQKNFLDRMMAITGKSSEVSAVLADSVRQLSEITGHTSHANEQIARDAGEIASGSQNTLRFVDEAAAAAEGISSHLGRIAEEGMRIADISGQVRQMTDENGRVLQEAVEGVRSIAQVTGESKEIIHKLEEKSGEIGRIVEIITGISGQTNLLALNAAIESARAGEQGKGFAVVASEIRGLAEQSQKAAKDIATLIREVLEDTQKAVAAMDRGAEMVDRGLAVINRAGEAFEKVSEAGRDMNEKVQEVSEVTVKVAEESGKIVDIVRQIREINHKSLTELQSIAAASEEQLASMQQVASSVDAIEQISGELLEVVK